MYAQILTINIKEGKIEELRELYRDYIVPEVSRQPGYRGFYLIDRPRQQQVQAITVWKNRDAADGGVEDNMFLEQRAGYPLYSTAPEREVQEILYFDLPK
ncbi:MAG TPA: antibiotic biosynthesis monooxygenase [bacterium]|nr:antibiotic biosynthesis monooxygenase [bacterium]HPJ71200.1 antibiotic biosynthesis monooxygenase [bacterium]